MHSLKLTTRFKESAYQGDACLFVYDEQILSGTMLSDDVRDQFESRPSTARIYILAPFESEEDVRSCFLSGALFARVRNYFHAVGGRLFLLVFRDVDGKKVSFALPFTVDAAGNPIEEPAQPIDDELRNGWLFDLFDKNSGRVDAPLGVHFGKTSGKHADKFLRVSGVLLSSAACAAIAYFTLGNIENTQPKRIFVDTAPLLAVAFAMQRIARKHRIWDLDAPIHSFSSYGGLTLLPPPSGSDLVLISASTSGGLVSLLKERGFAETRLITLYFLKAAVSSSTAGGVICDLTFNAGQSFGYPQIESYIAKSCPLCEAGYFLAELEGDQFQLEKRSVKTLMVKGVAQKEDARKSLEILARKDIFKVKLFDSRSRSSEFSISEDDTLNKVPELRVKVIRAMKRFIPLPLDYVILVGVSKAVFKGLIAEAGLANFVGDVKLLNYGDLGKAESIPNGGALVLFGVLDDFSVARDINAQLRTLVPKGCVSYISALTIADSAEHLSDLNTFLTYGEEKKDTFTYYSAANLMLPLRGDEVSPWDLELEFLRQIREDGVVGAEVNARIDILLDNGERNMSLFWPGAEGQLEIKNDFVYLSTIENREAISQADIYATVSNLLATMRADNRGLTAPVVMGKDPIRWGQSVYGHVLLNPGNFEIYNDAILHAAFLRGAHSAELQYFSDHNLSARIFSVIQALVNRWGVGGGESLPEFLISLATKRLTLSASHTSKLKELLVGSGLPEYLNIISGKI